MNAAAFLSGWWSGVWSVLGAEVVVGLAILAVKWIRAGQRALEVADREDIALDAEALWPEDLAEDEAA